MFQKLLNSLFKPSWAKGSVEQRVKAIEAIDANTDKGKQILSDLAVNNDNATIRNTALKRIKDSDLLENMVKQAKDDELKTAIQRQLVNSVDSDALHRLGESDLLDVVLQHRVASVRLAAAEQISTEGLFDIIVKESKDKAVLRHARAQLKLTREAQAQEAAKSKAIDDICEQLEHLAGRGGVDQFFLAKYDKAIQSWETLETQPTEEQTKRFKTAIKACKEDVEHLQAEKAEKAAAEQAKATFDAVLADMATQVEQAKNQAPAQSALGAFLNTAKTHWNEAKAHAQPTEAQRQSFKTQRKTLKAILNALTALMEKEAEIAEAIKQIDLFETASPDEVVAMRDSVQPLQKSLNWPENMAKPVLLSHWEQALYKLKQQERQISHNEEEVIRVLMRQRRQLDAHIEKGELKIANRIHGRMHDELALLTPSERERQDVRLKPLEEKLQKLRDWHGYSTEPKKEDLCARMEALATTEMDALDKAEAIKALQEEWREQTAVNIIEDDPLWTRFKEAGNTAYEPCAEYYDKLSQTKQSNLQKRRELVVQLNDYVTGLDWEKADWKKVQTTLRTARNEWKQYEPVKYPDAKPVHGQFFDLVNVINDKIKAHWQGIQEEKEALIEQAIAQKDVEDNQKAIEKIIFLQKQWKELGSTFRSKEQKLWKTFRSACDEVFARCDEARQAERAETDGHIQMAESMVEKMNAFAKGDDESLVKTSDAVAELQQAFAGLNVTETLPEKIGKAISNKFNDARIAYDKNASGVAHRKKIHAVKSLVDVATWLGEQESAVLGGGEFDETEWASLQSTLDSADEALIAERVTALQAKTVDGQLKPNRHALEQMAIELEVLLDLDTPEEFKGERRAYQLDQISQGRVGSKDSEDVQNEFFDLIKQWVGVGAVEQDVRNALQARFDKAMEKSDI